jgi:hypothetical protein
MCKSKPEICSTLTFLLGSGFGFAVCYFDDSMILHVHPIAAVVLAGIAFYITQVGKSFLSKKF